MSSTTADTSNPFVAAIDRAIERLTVLKACAPKPIRIFPGPSDFLEAGRFLKETAEIFDDYVADIGFEVADNSPFPIDERAFDHVASGAVTDATYACETVADRLIDERRVA